MKLKIFLIAILAIGSISVMSCRTPKNKTAYMNKTYRKLKRKLKDAEVTKLNDTVRVLFPTHLMFGFNSSSISDEAVPKMHRFAKALNQYNKTAILVNGHTDNKGSEEYNNNLSQQRADTAKSKLVFYKVSDERIKTWGMGMRHPIADNSTETGRAKNRRVEFVILYHEKSGDKK